MVATISVAAAVLVGCNAQGEGVEDPTTTSSTPPRENSIEDGTHFADVIVGEDQGGRVTLGVDLADFLTGEEARQAAVDAGVIGEGEDLPNDFFIVNDDEKYELLHVADAAEFAMISALTPDTEIVLDVDAFVSLYEGTYDADDVYGVVAGTPIAMDVTVADGQVLSATAVYLP